MKALSVLGIDIGASSGRGIIGRFDGNVLVLEEVHRFSNRPVRVLAGFYWDILNLYNEAKISISKANAAEKNVASIGVDTWSQDFALIDSQGNMLGNPHHYRDKRTEGIESEVRAVCSEYEIFSLTGTLPNSICTLYQIMSMRAREGSILDSARHLLFIPDLINYFLTGNISCNDTLASVSMLYNPLINNWSDEITKKFKIPQILAEVAASGRVIGNILKETSDELGSKSMPVISVAAHDTASAFASMQGIDDDEICISCGTWSVLGTILEKPLINKQVYDMKFCNEMGYNNKIIFVKNITGLWVIQECMNEWANEGYKPDFGYLDESAEHSNYNSFIDMDSYEFSQPGGMSQKVYNYCKRTNQPVPQSREDIYRCVILSLALKYRSSIGELEKITGKKYEKIHIIGGGAKNKFLCKAVSELTCREVLAGPCEATSVGNILAQLMALNEITDRTEAESVIKYSFPITSYYPGKLSGLNNIF